MFYRQMETPIFAISMKTVESGLDMVESVP